MPKSFQQQILKYRDWKDAQRSLLGKMLLKNGLEILGLDQYDLSEIKYTAHQRPYFDHSLDFNIAHSGDYVICAISTTQKVGVDIEELKTTELSDFQDFFTREEWAKVLNSNKGLQEFYTLWTQKEAIIKASGEGLSIPLKEVSIQEDKASVSNEQWHLVQLPLSPDYVSFLATNSEASPVSLHEINFD